MTRPHVLMKRDKRREVVSDRGGDVLLATGSLGARLRDGNDDDSGTDGSGESNDRFSALDCRRERRNREMERYGDDVSTLLTIVGVDCRSTVTLVDSKS